MSVGRDDVDFGEQQQIRAINRIHSRPSRLSSASVWRAFLVLDFFILVCLAGLKALY